MRRIPLLSLILALFFMLVTAGTALSDEIITMDFSGTLASGSYADTSYTPVPNLVDLAGMQFQGKMSLDLFSTPLFTGEDGRITSLLINVQGLNVTLDGGDVLFYDYINSTTDAFGIKLVNDNYGEWDGTIDINYNVAGSYVSSFYDNQGDPTNGAPWYWSLTAGDVAYCPAVPEPSSILLCGLGLVSLVAYRKRFIKA